MSRSGYNDEPDCDWRWIMWRGAVSSAINGRRGQAFIRELGDALDAMPVKRLVTEVFKTEVPAFIPPPLADTVAPSVCALGALGMRRGLDLTRMEHKEDKEIALIFGVASALLREIEYINDEATELLTPEQRWTYVRTWVERNILLPEEP